MMLEDDQTEFVDMILTKCRSLKKNSASLFDRSNDASSSLDLVRAIQITKTRTGDDEITEKAAYKFIKEKANNFTSKQALEIHIKDLLERGKTNKAFVLINNAIKFHYREPALWQLLGTIYQLKAQEVSDDFLMQKAVVAFQKSAKYSSIQLNGSRNRGRLARDCLLNSASYLQVISYVLEAEIA